MRKKVLIFQPGTGIKTQGKVRIKIRKRSQISKQGFKGSGRRQLKKKNPKVKTHKKTHKEKAGKQDTGYITNWQRTHGNR